MLTDEHASAGEATALLPAVVRVRLPHPADPHAVEAVLTRSIASIDPPTIAEVVWIPLLSATRPTHHRPELTYALVLRPALAADESTERLLRRAKKAAKKSLRRAFGPRSEVAVRFAGTSEEVATCFRAMIGNPRDAQP
jgi:hypothetical protein